MTRELSPDEQAAPGPPATASAPEKRPRVLRSDLEALLGASAEPAILLDVSGRILALNAAAASWLEGSPEELEGREISAWLTSDAARELAERASEAIAWGEPVEFEERAGPRIALYRIIPLRGVDGEVRQLALHLRDVSASRQLESALREARHRWQTISEVISDFAFSFRLLPDGTLESEWVTDSVDRLTGLPLEAREARGGWLSYLHPEDRADALARMKGALERGEEGTATFRMVRADGEVRNVRVFARPLAGGAPGEPDRLVGAGQDVTEQVAAAEAIRRSEERFRHQALHDELTGLPNRRAFLDELRRALERGRRRPSHLAALLFLDLDHFKDVNDRYGHLHGDGVLAAVATQLEKSVRPGDRVGRIGGDEFGILLDDLNDPAEAIRVAERVRLDLRDPSVVDGVETTVDTSIGIAFSSTGYAGPEEMIRDADLALYRAKAAGRGRFEIFDAEMSARTAALLALESELPGAVERDEMLLHYQPVVRASDGNVEAVEALLRWRHPRLGLLLPDDFVALAEETGAIVSLGEWVLRTACLEAAAWPSPAVLCVNLSERQIRDRSLARMVSHILAASGLPPQRLQLEVAEPAVMALDGSVVAGIDDLARLGVRLALDDVGSGALRLQRLARLPFSTLKIHPSLVVAAPDDPRPLSAAVSVGRVLGMRAVAEGVETEAQLEAARAAGCEAFQGRWICPPVPAASLVGVLKDGPDRFRPVGSGSGHVGEDPFGDHPDRAGVRHGHPLALTRLILTYHLLRKFRDVSRMAFAPARRRAEPAPGPGSREEPSRGGAMTDRPAAADLAARRRLAATTIRTLAMDAVQKANSGHPGLPMGRRRWRYVLFSRYLRFDPRDPALAGPRPLRAVGRARLDAALRVPAPHRLRPAARRPQGVPPVGQPDARAIPRTACTPGVEVTTGPLGQGFGNAVGHGASPSAPGRALQPPRAHGRRPPHLRARQRRRPDGGVSPRGGVAGRPPRSWAS